VDSALQLDLNQLLLKQWHDNTENNPSNPDPDFWSLIKVFSRRRFRGNNYLLSKQYCINSCRFDLLRKMRIFTTGIFILTKVRDVSLFFF
tara:strand:+ start:499 stop:768 length:270 start_codon:yes stop_codon:yes gene_type:complete